MKTDLHGKRIAILATDGFEESELFSPREALGQAGAETFVIAPQSGKIKAWDGEEKDWGESVEVSLELKGTDPDGFDALVLPGGVMNPDTLRTDPEAVAFVRHFFEAGKPVAAICHGPQLLIEAGVVKGRELTSFPSLKTDLINAGANWVDEEVVVDNGLVTSRRPADLEAFNAKLIEEVGEGLHSGQAAKTLAMSR
jgi:protease I